MEAPQITVICLYALGFTLHAVKHGEQMNFKEYNAGRKILDIIISASILYWGGFWD